MAQRTVGSLLAQMVDGVSIVISDNSSPDHSGVLQSWCLGQDPSGEVLRYLRPPGEMPMAQHWQWALDAVGGAASHVALITDRYLLLRPNALAALMALLGRFPNDLVVYNADTINDAEEPARLHPSGLSGIVAAVDAAAIEDWYVQSFRWPAYFPRLMNCVVPNSFFTANGAPDYFTGCLSPDFAFGFRILRHIPRLLYWDYPFTCGHATSASNGLSNLWRRPSEASADYWKLIKLEDQGGYVTPITEFLLVNAILHEYLVAPPGPLRQPPAYSKVAYAVAIARELVYLDPDLRSFVVQEVRSKLAVEIGEQPATALWRRLAERARSGQFRELAWGLNRRVQSLLWQGHLQSIQLALVQRGTLPLSERSCLRLSPAAATDVVRQARRRARRSLSVDTVDRGPVRQPLGRILPVADSPRDPALHVSAR